jgi:AcrR family transcriptional regulator
MVLPWFNWTAAFLNLMMNKISNNILMSTLAIAKEENWPAVTIRRIAESSGMSVANVYNHFSSKELILDSLSQEGFKMLADTVLLSIARSADPAEQFKAGWLAYWNFTREEKELYQLMFDLDPRIASGTIVKDRIEPVIDPLLAALRNAVHCMEESDVIRHFYLYWSLIHGLASLYFLDNRLSASFCMEILTTYMDALNAADSLSIS